MDLMLLRLFQRQVAVQCRYVLRASHELQEPFRDVESRFYSIQTILVSAANISKALWGHRTTYIEVRRPLRESLGVDDTWELRNLVVRHHFEHYDQRLTQWYDESESHIHVDMNVAPLNDRFISPPPDDHDIFRHFDAESGEVVFWGDRFNIVQVINEAARLLPLAEQEASKPAWEPPAPPLGTDRGDR